MFFSLGTFDSKNYSIHVYVNSVLKHGLHKQGGDIFQKYIILEFSPYNNVNCESYFLLYA